MSNIYSKIDIGAHKMDVGIPFQNVEKVSFTHFFSIIGEKWTERP